jgi:hypothetical protein
VVTACQQVCPTRAITFGDINDAGSEVARLRKSPLNYGMLVELNTRPRTTYLARIRNPNAELEQPKAESTTSTRNGIATEHKAMGFEEIPQVVDLRHTYDSATDKINAVILSKKSPWQLLVAMAISFFVMGLLFTTIAKLVSTGIGIWGNNQPVAWAFDIINFVWWIGIGHAGTLISAILFLFRQEWRTSINRFAEAMTIFAVMCAGLFPLLHVGRPWMAYWLFPYVNVMQMWPQFRSPLIWDVFAVSTYFTISLVFWYTGLIPDLASLRDRAKPGWPR